jgi:predicted DNA-binding protein (MmcQ/YjbR family)
MTTLEELQRICNGFSSVTTDIKWENHLCFNIGDKFFLVTAPDSVPVSATFKAADEDFDNLCARPGCSPAPYLARYKWVHVDDIGRFSVSEWEQLLKTSYGLVASKLPGKQRKALGIS